VSPKPTLEQNTQLLANRHRANLHILVVDDDYVTQQLLQRLLSSHYGVTVCGTVERAVHDYLRIMPDLVFLDIDLGDAEFNGFDVAYTIAMHDAESTIVMLSAYEHPENIAQATRAGASGFMAKPLSASRILHYVQECERSKFQREQ
jgi:DNA-binding NtrC family response regulator